MSKVKLVDKNSNWGGMLNLALNSAMSQDECLETVNILKDISQNKFYTINVFDIALSLYLGDCELIDELSTVYVLNNTYMNADGELCAIRYRFFKDGRYDRTHKKYGKMSDIISRLDTIEQKLNEITTND
jgi:hypothetical protein